MITTPKQIVLYAIATLLMVVGLVRRPVHPGHDVSSAFEICCFVIASALLALFVLWLWRTRRDGVRLYWIFWVVGFQELVCIQEFFYLLSRAMAVR